MPQATLHPVRLANGRRAQTPRSAYWGPKDCGGGQEPRPTGYKSNALCECRIAPVQDIQGAVMHPIRSAYSEDDGCKDLKPRDWKVRVTSSRARRVANFDAQEDCGCTQNATGDACY